MIKTMKISKLIKALQDIKRVEGDLPIVLSSDVEGNSYGSISEDLYGLEGGVIALYPFVETDKMTDFVAE